MGDEEREKSPADMSWGEIAYRAYALFTDGKTFDGRDMPKWEELPPNIRGAWEAAGNSVEKESFTRYQEDE